MDARPFDPKFNNPYEEPLITSFAAQLSDPQVAKLKEYLNDHGYLFRSVDYAHFGAASKTEKINLTMYKSGKLFIQGKGAGDFVRFFLEPEILKAAKLGYEDTIDEKGNVDRIGIDESGKGDYFGPLVIASVFVAKGQAQGLRNMGVKDSKNLTDKMAEILAAKIKKTQPYSTVVIGPAKYNELYGKINNLNKLLAWGHARAIENLLEKVNCKKAISDQFGNKKLIENALLKKGKEIELIQRHKAESDMAVAAASIIARAEFLRSLKRIEEAQKMEVCKGASTKAQELAFKMAQEKGIDILGQVAKLHFKTTDVIREKMGLPVSPRPAKPAFIKYRSAEKKSPELIATPMTSPSSDAPATP